MLKNLASALILTERDAEGEDERARGEGPDHHDGVQGEGSSPARREEHHARLQGARPCRCLAEHGTDAARNSDAWKAWRKSDKWKKWATAIAPAVASRRRLQQMLGDKTGRDGVALDGRAPLSRSARRLYASAQAGQAAPGRCRSAGNFGIRRRSRSAGSRSPRSRPSVMNRPRRRRPSGS